MAPAAGTFGLSADADLRIAEAEHRLICGDCLTVLPTLDSGSVDLVVTSPPYNLGIAYGRYSDTRQEADYLAWMEAVADALRRVMKPDASFFLNISGSPLQPWLPFELIVRLRRLFVMQNHIVWVKAIAVPDTAVGHHKPVGGTRFLNRNHEHLFHLTLTGDVVLDRTAVGVPFKDKSNIARRGHARDLRCRGDTWFVPYETVQRRSGKHDHPGTYPLALPRWCIRLHGRPEPVVLDPFSGVGTTVLAAALEGGRGIGIEIDPAYVETARSRLAAAAAAA